MSIRKTLCLVFGKSRTTNKKLSKTCDFSRYFVALCLFFSPITFVYIRRTLVTIQGQEFEFLLFGTIYSIIMPFISRLDGLAFVQIEINDSWLLGKREKIKQN